MRSLLFILLLAATCASASAQRFVKVFDKISALLAANPNDVHTNAYVTGRTTANDGGGAIYTWNSSSTAATNSNLSILKANNFSTGRWFRDNGFTLTTLTTDRLVGVGSDSILTNTSVTITQLETLVDTENTFATVADMVASTITTLTGSATVAGRLSENDGGGGEFYYDSASVATTNLGTIFPTSGTGRWMRIFSGPLNALWFGASVAGNASSAIQAALNLAGAGTTTNHAVYVPPSSSPYIIGTTLTVPNATKLYSDVKYGAIFDVQINGAPAISVTGPQWNWEISGLSLVANPLSTPTDGISLVDGREGFIHHNIITGFDRAGIHLGTGSWSMEIYGNSIVLCDYGILIDGAQVNAPNIHDNLINANITAGVKVSEYVAGLRLVGNQIELNGYGIWVRGSVAGQTRVYGMAINNNYYEGALTNRFLVIDEQSGRTNFVRNVSVQDNMMWCGAQDYAMEFNNPGGECYVTIGGNTVWGVNIATTRAVSAQDYAIVTDMIAFGASGYDDHARKPTLAGTTETGDVGVNHGITFAAMSAKTNGQPLFYHAKSQGGEVMLLRYTEDAIDGIPADVWNWDLAGLTGKPLYLSLFRDPIAVFGNRLEVHKTIYNATLDPGTVLVSDSGRVITSSDVLTNELHQLTGISQFQTIQQQLNSISNNAANWRALGTSNSTLTGIAYPWAVQATNNITVGIAGAGSEAGVIDLSSTNGTWTQRITVDSDGKLAGYFGTTNLFKFALDPGWTGAGTKFYSDDGTFKTFTSGTITGGANLGAGTSGPFNSVSGANLQFNSFAAGSGITVSSNANVITIAATGSGGTITGGANLASGVGVFNGVNGANLEFNTLLGAAGISWSSNANALTATLAVTNHTTIALSNPQAVLTPGENANFWRIPFASRLTNVTALLLIPSSSGDVTLDLKRNGVSILTAPVSITSGNTNATATLSASAMSAGDIITGDVDAAGTGAQGAQIQLLYVTP